MKSRVDYYILLCIACYLSSYFFPAFYFGAHEPWWPFALLLGGWFGAFIGVFSWYANPLFVAAVALSRDRRLSAVLAGLGLCVGASFLFQDKIMIDEAGHYSAIVGYGAGYILWMASLALLVVGQLVRAFRRKLPAGVA